MLMACTRGARVHWTRIYLRSVLSSRPVLRTLPSLEWLLFDFNPEADVDCQNKPQINAKIDHELVANCTRHNDKAIALTFTAKGVKPNKTTFMLNSIEPPPPPLALAPGLLYSDPTPGN